MNDAEMIKQLTALVEAQLVEIERLARALEASNQRSAFHSREQVERFMRAAT